MIAIKNLSKKYGDKTVYDNFNLSLKEGEITCILGASGCGKTTLLNALAGIVRCDGEIPALKCSYIFQQPHLVPNLTVFNNLSLVCSDADEINKMLEKVGLSDKALSFPVKLSGGEAQRVAIARAFLFKTDVLLMDEPLSSLDLKLKNQILELFFELWKNDGRTVLFVTHDVDEAAAVAQRIIVLQEGKIIYDYTPELTVPRGLKESSSIREKLIDLMLK